MCRQRGPTLLQLATALFAASLLGGCAAIPGLGGEEDPNPPTELDKKMVQQVDVRTLWQTRIGKGTGGRQLHLVPAVAGGRVYVAGNRGRIAALSAADGRTLWERETEYAFSGGPDVGGDVLVLGTTDGEIVTMSNRDGSQRWRAQLDSEVLSIPRIVGDAVVVHTIDNTVYALELADGGERWRYSYPAPVLTLHGSSTPTPAGDGVIVGFSGGRLVYIDLERGAPLWEVTVTPPRGRSELDRIADIDADPVVVDNIAYVGTFNGDLAAVSIDTGEILWRRELSAHAGLSADEASLYVTDSSDNVWAAERGDGAGRWRQDALANRRLTAPALLGNQLILGDFEGYVHILSRSDGRLLGFERIAKARIGHRPAIEGNTAFVYANDGTVAAVRTSGGARPAAGQP
ncbi:MAG: outer membrane protein assembly factor BamB [Thiohalocapsa sp.]|nr:outer membrane protein assembly factor BamB [Thiohalocapsa sp.]